MDISAYMQKYLAAKENVYWSTQALENEQKMLELGRSTLYDYSVAQNDR